MRVAAALIRQVILVDVRCVDRRLGGEQVEVLHQSPLIVVERGEPGRLALLEEHLDLGEGVALARLRLLVGIGLGAPLVEALEPLLDLRHVRQRELKVDDGDVREGIDLAVDVDDVVVVEASYDVDDGVALTNVGKEFVAETRTVRGALDEASDVDELDGGGHDVVLGGAGYRGERLEALVGDGDDAAVGLDGAERVVCSLRVAILDQCVEESGLADVGQADDAGLERHRGDRGGAESALRARGSG
mmetsp:Transcript_12449/g.53536  ORF Transcript_12449/g.53536 Transcript_12449/m.53536 type:complete len:246 (+) Transcript_12449:1128-1865(+)